MVRGASQHLPGLWPPVVLWVTPGVLSLCPEKGHPVAKFFETHVPEAVVALLAALLLFVLPMGLVPPPVHDRLGRGGEDRLGHNSVVRRWPEVPLCRRLETKVAEALGESLTEHDRPERPPESLRHWP